MLLQVFFLPIRKNIPYNRSHTKVGHRTGYKVYIKEEQSLIIYIYKEKRTVPAFRRRFRRE
jgi:hypothetical protein